MCAPPGPDQTAAAAGPACRRSESCGECSRSRGLPCFGGKAPATMPSGLAVAMIDLSRMIDLIWPFRCGSPGFSRKVDHRSSVLLPAELRPGSLVLFRSPWSSSTPRALKSLNIPEGVQEDQRFSPADLY